MKTAIFLGAGASAAEGAPVQNNLFKEYFKSVNRSRAAGILTSSEQEMERQLKDFFKTMFEIDVEPSISDASAFPSFEEVLGLLDLAELRREAFKKYELEDYGKHGNRLRLIRKYVVLAMAKAIADPLAQTKGLHRTLVKNLEGANLLNQTVFITTNYDIVIDNALTSLSENNPGQNLDYGVEFTNFNRGNQSDWNKPGAGAVPLYKLHGSLNWLYCANCNTLTLTPNRKGVIDLITDADVSMDSAMCRDCPSVMSPIIVPPTFYKDMSRVFLSEIWNKAEQALRQVDRIIFCGYSFPDADMHIKYLLKRVQANRPNPKTLSFTVVNHYEGKDPKQAKEEKARYDRFLGAKTVHYSDSGFEDFVKVPKQFYP
jgi:NAD-dependent SIR2 family protein deacetylase